MIETNHLKIIPLSYNQLTKYLCADDILEKEIGLTITGRTISQQVKDMLESFTLPRMKEALGNNYLFHTCWLVIDKQKNAIVAELGFKGEPDHRGEIEIGYGTMPDQQGKGYMTKAVSAMINWASNRDDVTSILAETHKNNIASIRIVEKNGFEQFKKKQEMLWWRKKVKHK